MRQSWTDIVAKYRELRELWDGAPQASVAGIEQVAIMIAEGPLNSVLFGWTSMHDLCIQQTDREPGTGPFLRISPEESGPVRFSLTHRYFGTVQFEYIDTWNEKRRWRRVVSPEAAPTRLIEFLDQLRWAPHITRVAKA